MCLRLSNNGMLSTTQQHLTSVGSLIGVSSSECRRLPHRSVAQALTLTTGPDQQTSLDQRCSFSLGEANVTMSQRLLKGSGSGLGMATTA